MENVPYESSLMRQRKKLKPEALTDLFRSHARKVAERTACSEMEHRDIDGTSFRYESSARNTDEKYHQSGPTGSADNGAWRQEATALYSVEKDLLLDVTVHGVKGKTGEPADLCESVDRRPVHEGEKVLYVTDRIYGTCNCLAHLKETGGYFLVRGKDIDSNGLAARLDLPDEAFDRDVLICLGRCLPFDVQLLEGVYNTTLAVNARFDYLGPYSIPCESHVFSSPAGNGSCSSQIYPAANTRCTI